MGFEKTVEYLGNNWSSKVERLFTQSFLYIDENNYFQLFKLFCHKRFKEGIVFILNNKRDISQEEIMLLQDNLDEFTIKEILLTLLTTGMANYSKIIFIAENLQSDWGIEFVFYILNKINIKSLNAINVDNFINNVNNTLKNITPDIQDKIIKTFEKNISLWQDVPAVWNILLPHDNVYEIFIKQFFSDTLVSLHNDEFLQQIDCKHYIKIIKFLISSHRIDKKYKNNFYQFLHRVKSPQFLNEFLDFLAPMSVAGIADFAFNFSTIPFMHLMLAQKEIDGRKFLLYLFFIYSSSLSLEDKRNFLKNILDSEKIIDLTSIYANDLPIQFIQMIVSLDIKSFSGLLFVLDVVDKNGDTSLIQNLPTRYKDCPDPIKPRITEIFAKHSLKKVLLNEKKDFNINVFIEILKKVPPSVTTDIISLIYHSSANVKVRLIKLVELINYDKGIEKIIETLMYKDKDKKVRATCIRLLKLLKEDEALKHVRILLFDEDSRVRANAVEIFEYFANIDNWFVLLALANDPNNRVRANVAKAIFRFSKQHSLEILNGMINSNQELFVLSALWVIEKLSLYDEFINTLEDLDKKHISIKIKNRLNKMFTNIRKV